MTTIHNLQLLAVDLEQRVTREIQLQNDAQRQVLEALQTAREALAHLEVTINNAFQGVNRSLSATLGNGKSVPETIENKEEKPRAKPKLTSVGESTD